MSTHSAQISHTPESPVLFCLFNNEVMPGKKAHCTHSHPEYEITIVLSGHGVYTVDNDRQYDARPGDVFLLRSNENHYLSMVYPGENCRTIGIHFLPQFIVSQSGSLFDIKCLSAFLSQERTFENRLPREHPIVETIIDLMEEIKEEYDKKLPDYELFIRIILLKILMTINRNYGLSENEELSILTDRHFSMLSDSIKYIDEHVTENLTLEKLAEISKMSVSYYCRIFKTANRISPMEYIIRKRIDLAKMELKRTDSNILDLAYRCGFNNSANFNRAFKQRTGQTPSEFRKQVSIADTIDFDCTYTL